MLKLGVNVQKSLRTTVLKGVLMSLQLKCVFIRQNISRKTECVLLLNAVKLLHVRLRDIACFLSY